MIRSGSLVLFAWSLALLVPSNDVYTVCHAWQVVVPPPPRRRPANTVYQFSTKKERPRLVALQSSSKNDNNDKGISSAIDSEFDETSSQSQKSTARPVAEEDQPAWILALRRWQPRQQTVDLDLENQTVAPLGSLSNETGSNATFTSLPSFIDPFLQTIMSVQDVLPPLNPSSVVMRNDTSRTLLDLLDAPPDANGNGTLMSRGSSSLAEEVDAILDSLQDTALIVNVSSSINSSNTIPTTDWLNYGWDSWDRWMYNMQRSLLQTPAASNLTTAAEGILKQATAQLDKLLSDVQPTSLQSVLEVANATAMAVAATESLDINEAVERAYELTKFAGEVSGVADGLIRKGYVSSPSETDISTTRLSKTPATTDSEGRLRSGRALFEGFASAREVDRYTPILGQAAEMAALSGAIYEQTVPRSLQLGHSIVARGCSLDVKWMVTDSLASHSAMELYKDRIDNDPSETPLLIRTITIRGFDASDEDVDRETLVTEVCRANALPLDRNKRIKVHAGLWRIAKAIYKDIKQYIEWASPEHKLILNGHSIGGSVANLVLFLLTLEKGADFVENRVLRVYTFGSPPVAALSESRDISSTEGGPRRKVSASGLHCSVLESLGLPTNLVWAFVQPWDPICRLFSDIDPLYPLVDGMKSPGADGITPWPKGPPRTLRPITKAIFEAWDGWPRFRDTYFETGSQNYAAIGVQHILLPEATRYLTDRFLTVSIAVPPVRSVLRVCPTEIYPALVAAFPLDVFEVSYVPQAIRSFVHHFYPAYGYPLVEYVRLLEKRAEPLLVRDNLATAWPADEWVEGEGQESDDRNEDISPWGLAGELIQNTMPNRSRNNTAALR